MNLKNGQITIRELMQHPQARMLLRQEFPMLAGSSMLGQAGNMTLNAAIGVARRYVAPQKIAQTIARLKSI